MNTKKRKFEDVDDDNVSKQPIQKKETESVCTVSAFNRNLPNSKKLVNGGPSNLPGSANETILAEKSKDTSYSSTDQHESNLACLEGSNVIGTLLFSGGTNWDLIGHNELPKHAKDSVGENLWGPHRLASLSGIRVTAVFSGCCSVHSVIIVEHGKVMTWGKNDKGQLGHGDTVRRDIPTLVETLKDHNIISAACGRSHTLYLSDKGIVYSSGDNKRGQCGVGSKSNGSKSNAISNPTKIKFKGKSITQVACGAEFSVIVDVKGLIYSFGCSEYGQLGHNSDGRYFITSNKLSFRCELVPRRILVFIEKNRDGHATLVEDVQISNVACGTNHTVAVDSNKRCFSWGFGGYGRLGHAEPKDEMVPRLVKGFVQGVNKVFAGGTFSLAINESDVLYFWGQNKRTGEATMYPKPVHDLCGWQVRSASCSHSSIVCIADDSVVSWGPCPTYGELAYGESRQKSSTVPQEVKPLDGINIHSIACGYGHTLFIACDETEQDRNIINKLPEHSPQLSNHV